MYQTDWCGVDTPQLCGFVDVAIFMDGVWLGIGKIKRGNTSSFIQAVAGMQAVAKRDGVWPYGEGFDIFDLQEEHGFENGMLSRSCIPC